MPGDGRHLARRLEAGLAALLVDRPPSSRPEPERAPPVATRLAAGRHTPRRQDDNHTVLQRLERAVFRELTIVRVVTMCTHTGTPEWAD
jgi:hypothetical protein